MNHYIINLFANDEHCWLPAFDGRGESKRGEAILRLSCAQDEEYARNWAKSIYPEAHTITVRKGRFLE